MNDQHDYLFYLIKVIGASLFAWLLQITDPYIGAVFIAAFAATVRILFSAEQSTKPLPGRWFKKFIQNALVTFVIFHTGAWQSWDTNLTIIVSASLAFVSDELLGAVVAGAKYFKDNMGTIINNRIGGNNDKS